MNTGRHFVHIFVCIAEITPKIPTFMLAFLTREVSFSCRLINFPNLSDFPCFLLALCSLLYSKDLNFVNYSRTTFCRKWSLHSLLEHNPMKVFNSCNMCIVNPTWNVVSFYFLGCCRGGVWLWQGRGPIDMGKAGPTVCPSTHWARLMPITSHSGTSSYRNL